MSHIRCPLCGLDSAFSRFNPEELDLDIYVRSASGLGYRRGFSFGPDESVLGDDYFTPKIMDRCIDLLNLFIKNNIVTPKELSLMLRIGVPVKSTDKLYPFEDSLNIFIEQNKALQKRISLLEKKVISARPNVSIFEFEELRSRYNKLTNRLHVKKKIDNILKHLHANLDSKMIPGEEDWKLEVYECTPEIYLYLNKILYSLNRKERNILKNRIKTGCEEFNILFWIFERRPTITCINDIFVKKPGKVFYMLHNLPIPDYLEVQGKNFRYHNWGNPSVRSR